MFKHTTKKSILSGFFVGLAVFVSQYLVLDGSFDGLIMGLGIFMFEAFLRPHIMGEQRETREKEERGEGQT